tara:strand:+ start:107148 stop:107900 length:753 start_codon:yes stop_codon:yes gene_type:complete
VIEAFEAITAGQLALLWSVVIGASILRAFTGFGFGLAAVPVFSLFMAPSQAVVLGSLLVLMISLTTWRTFWGDYPVRQLTPLLLASLLGTAVGAAVLTMISVQQFQLWIGLTVIILSLSLAVYKPARRQAGGLLSSFTGLVSGLMNGAFAIPGPPIIIYAMATETEPRRSRALMMTFFLFSAVTALAIYAIAGFFTRATWLYLLLALPAVFLGDKLGYGLFKRFGNALYRRVALLLLLAIGAAITLQALA